MPLSLERSTPASFKRMLGVNAPPPQRPPQHPTDETQQSCEHHYEHDCTEHPSERRHAFWHSDRADRPIDGPAECGIDKPKDGAAEYGRKDSPTSPDIEAHRPEDGEGHDRETSVGKTQDTGGGRADRIEGKDDERAE